MSVAIPPGPTDDPAFIDLLNSLLRGLLAQGSPRELWVIQIDNWFDHKWLRFSGIGVVPFEFPAFTGRFDAALDEFHQDRLTFPSFAPNRVLAQWSFTATTDGYVEAPLPAVPHPHEKRPSSQNLQRRVADFSASACFVWYSGNSHPNAKASIIVYASEAQSTTAWFASFSRREHWTLDATRGISQPEVQRLIASDSIT